MTSRQLRRTETPLLALEWNDVQPRMGRARKLRFATVLVGWGGADLLYMIGALGLLYIGRGPWLGLMIAAPLWLLIVWGTTYPARHPLRVYRETGRRLVGVPSHIRIRARQFDLPSYRWMFAAIECYECHMPGDCPLCGAE